MNQVYANLTWGKLEELVDKAISCPNTYVAISGLENCTAAYLVPVFANKILVATDTNGCAILGEMSEYETLLSIATGIDMTFPQYSVATLRNTAHFYSIATKWAGPDADNRTAKVDVDAFVNYMTTKAPAGMFACCEWYLSLQDRNYQMVCGRIEFAGKEFFIVGAGREGSLDYHCIPVEATKKMEDAIWENIHVSVEDNVYVTPYLAGLLPKAAADVKKTRVEELQALDVLCQECMSETCAFNPNGICRYPLVFGFAPHLHDDGCSGWLENGNIT